MPLFEGFLLLNIRIERNGQFCKSLEFCGISDSLKAHFMKIGEIHSMHTNTWISIISMEFCSVMKVCLKDSETAISPGLSRLCDQANSCARKCELRNSVVLLVSLKLVRFEIFII
jgi:hypothetical protein